MTTLQSYLPLYLGQKVLVNKDNNRISVIITGMVRDLVFLNGWDTHVSNIQKIILRPLSSMTEEEAKEIFGIPPDWTLNFCWSANVNCNHYLLTRDPDVNDSGLEIELGEFAPDQFINLLSKGFDIFGLKEKGLCLYPEEL